MSGCADERYSRSDVCRDRVRMEWQDRTGQDRSGDNQTNTQSQMTNSIAWPQVDVFSSVLCSQTYHLTPYYEYKVSNAMPSRSCHVCNRVYYTVLSALHLLYSVFSFIRLGVTAWCRYKLQY